MALDRQIVTVPIAQGLDTKSDPKQLRPGKLVTLQNGVFTTGGKLRKRNGTNIRSTSIFGGGSIASADSVMCLRDELLLSAGGRLYTWAAGSSSWADKGPFVRTEVSASDSVGITIPRIHDMAYVGGMVCITAENTYALVDAASGALFATGLVSAGSALGARVVAFQGGFVLVYDNGGGLAFRTLSIAGVSGAEVAIDAAALAGDAHTFDVVQNGSSLFVAYRVGTNVSIRSISAAYAVSAATAFGYASAAIQEVTIAVDANNGNLLVAVSLNGGGPADSICLSVASSALAVVQAVLVIEGGVDHAGAAFPFAANDATGAVRVWYSVRSATTSKYQIRSTPAPNYVVGAPGGFLMHGRTNSHVFTAGGRPRFICSNELGGGFYVVDATTGGVVARWGAADGLELHSIAVGRVSMIGTAALYSYMSASGLSAFGSTRLIRVDFPATPAIGVNIGGVALFAGGRPTIYDGLSTTEQGFQSPGQTIPTVTVGAGTLTTGTYGLAVVYEWADATGAIHRSNPVFSSATIGGATGGITGAAWSLPFTDKSNVYVAIYRTIANGTVYYRDSVYLNDPYTETRSFLADTQSDATIVTQPSLYTTGGVIENVAAPPLSSVTVYRNRAVGINAEDPRQIWYSKQVIPGQPVEFSDFLTLNMDAAGGECSALAALDDKLIIFKPEVSFYLTGTGPDATGGQNDFSVPILINTNSGCVEPRSVVTAADGVMYQSRKGLFILDRSLQDHYIGDGVEAFNSATVRAATAVPTTSEVRFVLSTGDVLVYDFLYKQWAVFTGLSAVDACVWGNVYQVVKATGVVQYEAPGVFTDNGTAIELRFTTGWLGAGDLQSFLRVYKLMVLGAWKSSHTLNVWVQYDYRTDTAAANKYAIVATSDPSPAQFQYRVNLAQQKCEALAVTVFDSSASGESLDISALTFEVGAKRGPMRLPAGSNV